MKRTKTVCLVTILDVANFGTMLQAYALATVVERLGYRVVFLNYWRHDYTTLQKVRTFLSDKSLGFFLKRIAFALSALFFYSKIRNRVRCFVTKKFEFTRPFHSIDEVLKADLKIEIAICGSDQIWNSVYNGGVDKVFYLDFANCPRIAYAASSGINEFCPSELESIKAMLSRFSAISVRESQTCDYLRAIGFPQVQHVLDPSLLLDAEEWKKISKYATWHHPREKYLLVYSVERFNNDFIFSQARRIAHELNLKMYVVCTTYPVKAKDYGFDKIFAMSNVETFLNLMAGADFIVASSFHGTAFALNFNKEFVTIAANNFNIRMESLVHQFKIAHRIVRTTEISISDLNSIDYTYINDKLRYERNLSISFLKKNLSLC